MRTRPTLPLVLPLVLIACGQAGEDERHDASGADELATRVSTITGRDGYATSGPDGDDAAMLHGSDDADGYRTLTVNNPQFNVPMFHLDLPTRWPVRTAASGDWEVDGEGLRVKHMAGSNFTYASGQMAGFYQQSGMQLRPAIPAGQVVMEDLVPLMRQQGFELAGHQDAPAVAQADQRGLEGLYSVGRTRKVCQANISDWRRGEERLGLVMHWFAMDGGDLMNWGYYFTVLEADPARYEREKVALLHALASVRYDPAYFAAYARSEQQKEQQSWAAHNSRMQANQAAFDAQQAAHRDRVNSVNDAIMGTWRNTSSTMDRMQEATINGIRGEQNAVDPYTGAAMKLQSGYDRYWINSNGEYFGTNDPTYDPNVNADHVDQWRQVPTEP